MRARRLGKSITRARIIVLEMRHRRFVRGGESSCKSHGHRLVLVVCHVTLNDQPPTPPRSHCHYSSRWYGGLLVRARTSTVPHRTISLSLSLFAVYQHDKTEHLKKKLCKKRPKESARFAPTHPPVAILYLTTPKQKGCWAPRPSYSDCCYFRVSERYQERDTIRDTIRDTGTLSFLVRGSRRRSSGVSNR